MNLSERVAVITGAAGDIGRAACFEFARAGAKVVAVDVDAEQGERLVAELAQFGQANRFWRADVTRAEDVKAYVDGTLRAFGRVDAFFNNAGITGVVQPMPDYPEDVFDRVIAVNLKGAYLGLKYVLPVMLAQKFGSIINMSSAAGVVGFPGFAGYVASKHGVIGLTRTAAGECGSAGVRINAVCPGPIKLIVSHKIVLDTAERIC